MEFSRGSATEAGVAKEPNSDDVDTFAPAERFTPCNRPLSSFRKRGHAEIRQFAPFELGRSFDQGLGLFVEAKAEPLFPKSSVDLCWCCHDHLTLPFVGWTNFSRCALVSTT
jgi:hypothetical protein